MELLLIIGFVYYLNIQLEKESNKNFTQPPNYGDKYKDSIVGNKDEIKA